jgi:6-phosphogluconolactonase (cycloisomerase 2 family)
MKIGKMARWALAAAPLLLAGCGNFWQNPYTGNSSCTTNCPTTGSGNFYVIDQATNQIAGYNIASGGTLTALSGSPYALSAKPLSMAIAPGGGFLYVGTAAGIYAYAIDSSTGALAVANNGSVISTDLAGTMQMDPSGSWLVDSGPGLADVFAISIDSSTGLLASDTELHFNLPAATVQQLQISSDGAYVFVAMGTNGTAAIPFNSADADPFGTTYTHIPVKVNGGSALSVAIDPQNRVFYVGETLAATGNDPAGLRVFNYSSLTSTLTEVSGSPYATQGLQPAAILPDSTGAYVYVANGLGSGTDGNIAGFTLKTSSSSSSSSVTGLAAGSTVSAGIQPVGLAEDSTNTYVLAVSSGGDPDLAAFSFDTTTLGKLDSVLTASTGTDPVSASAIVAVPGS